MAEGTAEGPPLPDHPILREVALAVEEMGRVAEIVDRDWRIVYMSSELFAAAGVTVADASSVYGLSMVQRDERFPEIWGTDAPSGRRWWRANAPYMRSTLDPDAPQFGTATEAARRVAPVEPPPVWGTWTAFASDAYSQDQYLLHVRLNEPDGRFAGVLVVSWPRLPGAVTGMLSRGDVAMYERMARMSEPHRCETAILFADLEASGELSRTLSSRAYFELIRGVTTAFDTAVIANGGIVGRHAGDGASAFFCPTDHDGSASRAAAAAVNSAHQTRTALADLARDDDTSAVLNVGLHWGSMVMMGQIVTGGRLEVTALGDEVNEAARIQDAARGGRTLASKQLIEHLEPPEATTMGIDLARIVYRQLGQFGQVSEKVLRDAGTIAVADLSR